MVSPGGEDCVQLAKWRRRRDIGFLSVSLFLPAYHLDSCPSILKPATSWLLLPSCKSRRSYPIAGGNVLPTSPILSLSSYHIPISRLHAHYGTNTNNGRLARPGQAGRQSALEQQQRRTSDAGCRGRPAERLSQLGPVHHADAQSWSEGFQEMYVVAVLLLLPVAFRADSVFVS